jgi:hypothetical protein
VIGCDPGWKRTKDGGWSVGEVGLGYGPKTTKDVSLVAVKKEYNMGGVEVVGGLWLSVRYMTTCGWVGTTRATKHERARTKGQGTIKRIFVEGEFVSGRL